MYNDSLRYRDHTVAFTTPEKFIEWKIEMLETDFCIELTDKEKAHLKSLKTENAINAAVRKIMDDHWGC